MWKLSVPPLPWTLIDQTAVFPCLVDKGLDTQMGPFASELLQAFGRVGKNVAAVSLLFGATVHTTITAQHTRLSTISS